MKKLGIVLGVLVTLFLAAALILPSVVNVDQYRPKIVQAVNERLRGNFELGHLQLSLWGQIRIAVEGLSLKDQQNREILSVRDAYFHIPFLSILSGSPTLDFKMKEPVLNVVKNKVGQLNVMTLKKETAPAPGAPAATAPQAPQAQPSPSSTGGMELPGIVTRAKLGLEMRNALVHYQDEKTGLSTQVKDLNLVVRDLSMSRPTEWEVWADLNTQMGKSLKVEGPVRLTGKATPEFQGATFQQIKMTSHLDLDKLAILMPGLFEKKSGIPAHLDVALTGSEKLTVIDSLSAQFFNAEVKAKGAVYPQLAFEAGSNRVELSPWVELIPMLKDYQLNGAFRFVASAHGTSEQPQYKASFNLDGLTAKAPKLKTQPRFDAAVSVSTDQIDRMTLTMTAPGNQLSVDGKLVSFSKPRAEFQVISTGMDLDQLIDFPPAGQKAKATPPAGEAATPQKSGEEKGEGKTGPAKSDYDALLEPLRENPIAQNTVATVNLNMKSLKAYQVMMTDLTCKLLMKDLVLGMTSCGMKLFQGAVQAKADLQFKPPAHPKTPSYQFSTQVTSLNLSQAVESQMALFKNTVKGLASFSMTGQGESFNPESAMIRLKAKGNMGIQKATFATIDVMKMVQEAVNQSIGKIAEKVPALKGKGVNQLPGHESRYEVVSSDFTLQDGKFSAPNFIAKAIPKEGIDLKGATVVGILNYAVDANLEVSDTYNLTQLKDVSVDVSGVKVDHVFSEGNAPVRFPIHIGCTLMAPCYSYTQVPEYLGKVALNNISSALTGKAKDELRKQAEAAIKQAVPPSVQNQLQDKLKGLFN